MTETSYPQQGQLIGDATNAPYSADVFALEFMASLTGFGRRANYGPMKGYDDGTHYGLEVTQTSVASANVLLRVGAAIVTGTIYKNTADLSLAIGANASGNPRIDTVVLRKDFVLQTVRAAILQGAPAGSPVPPTLTQSATIWEIPIADIAVANGFSTLTDSNITSRHEWVNVGDGVYLDGVLNNSGGALDGGDVVIWNSGTARAVTTTTVANHGSPAGVWVGRTANGARGRMQVRGLARIRVRIQNIAASPINIPSGQYLVTGLLAKRATVVSVYGPQSLNSSIIGTQGTGSSNTGFAPVRVAVLAQDIAIGALTTFDDFVLAFVDIQQQRNPLLIRVVSESTGTFTSGAWRTRTLNRIRSDQTLATSNQYAAITGSNQVTIQPGLYYIQGRGSAYRVDRHQVRLQNITDTVTVEGSEGNIAYTPSAADSSQTESALTTFLSLSTAKVFELQHQCATTRATDGFGVSTAPFATPTFFAELLIWRLGDLP